MKVALIHNTNDGRVLQRREPDALESYHDTRVDTLLESLRSRGFETEAIDCDGYLMSRLAAFFDLETRVPFPGLALNVAYGIQGSMPYVHAPSMLEVLGVPYSGSDPLAHALCSDKTTTKILWRHEGLPTPDFVVVRPGEQVPHDVELPAIVKPHCSASSLGLAMVETREELVAQVETIHREYGQDALVEDYIEGGEGSVSLIGNPPRALPPIEVEIEGGGPFVLDNETKEERGDRRIVAHCPARFPGDLVGEMIELATRAWAVLHVRDWGRVDFRIDRDGRPWLLECNSLPHLGPDSAVPIAAREQGWDLSELLVRLVTVATDRYEHGPEVLGDLRADADGG